MNAISAPILDNFIAEAQLHPDLLSQVEKDALLHIIDKLQCVAVCGNDECRELWFTSEHGSIEDFGDYEEYLENEIISNEKEFEELWKEDYPDLVKWYLLSVRYIMNFIA